MDTEQAHKLAQQGAALRAQIAGIEIHFRGETLRVMAAANEDTLSLDTGGFERSVTVRFRFQESFSPRPAKGEVITIAATGATYRVTFSADLPWSPLAAEYLVEAKRS